ncbi:MAG: hypothetical protein IKX69_04510 [Prevotella sp.]|nr:hypothetical protein [Prevotella sp.]
MKDMLHLGKDTRFPSEYNEEGAKKMYFESDKEFTDFCVAPYAEIVRPENGSPYFEGRYSDEYLKCVKAGITFVVKDEDSQVYKHKCVSKRVPVRDEGVLLNRDTLVQLDVQNLEEYFDL